MPKVKIEKNFSAHNTNELFSAIQDILLSDKEVKALEPSLKIHPRTLGKNIEGEIKGSRIQGFFSIKETPSKGPKSADLLIELKLPFMLSPFKALVQNKIEKKLQSIT